ncbi:MAG: phospholipase C, phosphocholine-specific [Proteobacteria bacterium]|nr:phospholipase C, phosphocholine-specific [Pseudomonadota bacterium]
MNSRRRFLQASATAGVTAATLAAFPPSIRRALAIPAHNKTGTIQDVEHIVILMQENRSFDNYFGTLRGVRGFGDRFSIPLPNNMSVWQQLNASGAPVLPYHLDSSQGNAQRVSGTPHSWSDAQNAWDGGRMYQWPRYKTTASMGYYEEKELPFQFALANAFTLCDAYHCSLHAGTGPNRLFLWTGTNGPTGAGVGVVVNEFGAMGPSTSGFAWATYPERLQAAGVTWKVYQNLPDNFFNNALAGFVQYRRANEVSGKPVSNDSKVVSPAYDPASDDTGNPLYKGIANTMPDGGFLSTFRDDVKSGRLPQVTWLIAPAAYSEHPSPSSPVQGAWYVQETLDALTAVPEVWSKTVLLVDFDENDGFFDHMPSPSAPSLNPDGTSAGKTTLPESALAAERFTHPGPPTSKSQPMPDGRVYGPGVRVPMYVISPWSRGGWVNSQVFDHSSVIRFIEARFGVQEPNIGPFRRAVCGDLSSAFNFANPNHEPLPVLAGRKSKDQADALRAAQQQLPQVAPPANGQLPRQETGTRPSRALPYELQVHAALDSLKSTITLVFDNTGQAAAVFHVYDKLNLGRLPRRYMVEPGKQLSDVWPAMADNAGRYDLWVIGPNGLHRHFTGDLNRVRAADAPVPEVRVSYDAKHGEVHLRLLNTGGGECQLTVRAKAYRDDGPWIFKLKGGQERQHHWKLADSGNWYDFVVSCDADASYTRRFAGRVETGEHSVSDPAMGIPERT